MTLGRLFTIVVAFLFVTASCILVAGYVKNTEYEKLKAQAESAIEQAKKTTAINAPPSQEQSDAPKSISSRGYVQVKYEKRIAYYADTHLVAIEHLDLTEALLKREVFDLQGRLRVQLLYTMDRVTQEDYFDEKGKNIYQSVPSPPLGRPSY